MNYLILAFSILVSSAKSACSNVFGKNYLKTQTDIYGFNILCAASSIVMLILMVGKVNPPSEYTLLMSVLFGTIIMLLQISFFLSMATGSMAYTMLVTATGMIIPTAIGTFFWKESITVFQIIGLALLLGTFYLTVNPQKDEKITFRWLKYAAMSFLFSGGIGVIQKIFQTSAYKDEMDEFLILSFVVIGVFSAAMMLKRHGTGERFVFKSKPNWNSVVIGICDALVHKINLFLAGALPSIIVYPFLNMGAIVVSTVLSIVIFKEYLSKRQYWGLAMCIISILLISNIMNNFF